jgi:hypothetical protein
VDDAQARPALGLAGLDAAEVGRIHICVASYRHLGTVAAELTNALSEAD